MKWLLRRRVFLFLFVVTTPVLSVIDNRYLVLYHHSNPYRKRQHRRSLLADLFFMRASKGRSQTDQEIPFPELQGTYDLNKVGIALKQVTGTNPIRSDLRIPALPFTMEGKLHAQGVMFNFEQPIGNKALIGFRVPFIHASSQIEFLTQKAVIDKLDLGSNGDVVLHKELAKANKALGFDSYHWEKTGMGDFEWYVHIGSSVHYDRRFKRFDIGVNLGAIIPIDDGVNFSVPTAIPFGMWRHKGMFVEADLNFELKDDWYVGGWFQAVKRFSRVEERRLVVAGEHPDFGALIDYVDVDPGFTYGFSPYVLIEDLRDGLGFRARYTYIYHGKDSWHAQLKKYTGTVKTTDSTDGSKWSTEHVGLGFIYDMSRERRSDTDGVFRWHCDWEMPVKLFEANGGVRTHRIMVGFNFTF